MTVVRYCNLFVHSFIIAPNFTSQMTKVLKTLRTWCLILDFPREYLQFTTVVTDNKNRKKLRGSKQSH